MVDREPDMEVVLPCAPHLEPARVAGLVGRLDVRVAVYAGLRSLSSRPDAYAFDIKDVANAAEMGRRLGFSVYAAANAELDDNALESLVGAAPGLADAGVHAVIVSDLAAIRRLAGGPLPVHVSSIFPTYNLATLQALADMGVSRIVLPTNVAWEDIEAIAAGSGHCELELIVAGGVCFNDCARCGLPHDCVREGLVVGCREAVACGRNGTHTRAVWLPHADPGRLVNRAIRSGVKALKVEGRSERWEVVRDRIAGLCAALGEKQSHRRDPEAGAGVYER